MLLWPESTGFQMHMCVRTHKFTILLAFNFLVDEFEDDEELEKFKNSISFSSDKLFWNTEQRTPDHILKIICDFAAVGLFRIKLSWIF